MIALVEKADIVTIWWTTNDLNTEVFTNELWGDGGSDWQVILLIVALGEYFNTFLLSILESYAGGTWDLELSKYHLRGVYHNEVSEYKYPIGILKREVVTSVRTISQATNKM